MKNLLIPFLTFISLWCAAQTERGSVLIKNGTVLTITRGNLDATDVLVRDGKIAQIGEGIAAPAGVKVIDATGLFVMPGIIDAHSHIALDAVNEATNPVTAEVWEGDVINPFDMNIYRALAGGCTISHAMHGSANAIGGQCQTIKHRFGSYDPQALIMEGAVRTIKFALGENPTRVHGGNNIVPRTRMGVEFVIRQAFSEAKEYMEKWDKYNKNKTVKGFRGAPPAYSLRMETLADVLRGNIIIHCHSYRADEIYMLLKVCQDFGIKKLVFQHVNEGFKVAPELAAHGAMASVFADWWAYKFEVYYSTAYNAAILVRNGVVTSINSDSNDLIRHLYHEAAKTQKYGALTDEEALALITINPAIQLGIENRVGSIEVGKDADIAIFSGHPLSVYAVPQYTLVDGVVRFDRKNDPDDMRIMPDPKENLDAVTLHEYTGHKHESCLQNTEFLFTARIFGAFNFE
jgi:imidazolonepropionase-like amidohydrolase